MDSTDWSKFNVRICTSVALNKIRDAWMTGQAIEYWFLRKCIFQRGNRVLDQNEQVRVGDTYKWFWHGYDDDTIEEGEILEVDGECLFKFTFGNAGICTVNCYQEGDVSIMDIEQTEIPTDEKSKLYYHVGCKTGWTFHFTNFKSIMEGGLDLRNKDLDIVGVINA